MRRSGAQIIWETLVREGVSTIFGYPGGAILPAYDAMLDYPSIHHVLVRHEQGAAHMADGYARASGDVGVAIATSGPGATNLVTGIATAMMDSSPIVCITGQVAGSVIGKDAFQEADVTGVTLPITKHNYLVTRAEDIERSIREAFYVARSGRPGPVLVDITKYAQQASFDYEPVDSPIKLPGYRPRLTAAAEEYADALRLINEAERPVVLAGQGIILSGTTDLVRELVEKSEMPVAMTLLGLGSLPADHHFSLGMMGMHGESWVNTAIQDADLVISLGMRFDDRVTGKLEGYAARAKKIHVDIDPAEIGKNVAVDVGLVGHLMDVLHELLPAVKKRERPDWIGHIDTLRGDAAIRDIQRLPDDGHLYAAHVINDLWRVTKGEAIIVSDVGQNQMWTAQYYRQQQPRGLITSGGLGTMGFALPAAIGARFAKPDANIWVIAGDGGFQMTACELATCAQEGLNLNVAIINNGFLGMVRQWQEFFYERRYAGTPISSPDFVKLAEAHGLTGLRVEERSGVDSAVTRAQENPGTVVVDFRVEQEDSVYPMVPAGADLQDMIRRPENEHNAIFETGKDES
jgi:acetolactate synthase-1/2/3 large subunit